MLLIFFVSAVSLYVKFVHCLYNCTVDSVRKREPTARQFKLDVNVQNVGTLLKNQSERTKKKVSSGTQNTAAVAKNQNSGSKNSQTTFFNPVSSQQPGSRLTRSQVALLSGPGIKNASRTSASNKTSGTGSYQPSVVSARTSESADRAKRSAKSKDVSSRTESLHRGDTEPGGSSSARNRKASKASANKKAGYRATEKEKGVNSGRGGREDHTIQSLPFEASTTTGNNSLSEKSVTPSYSKAVAPEQASGSSRGASRSARMNALTSGKTILAHQSNAAPVRTQYTLRNTQISSSSETLATGEASNAANSIAITANNDLSTSAVTDRSLRAPVSTRSTARHDQPAAAAMVTSSSASASTRLTARYLVYINVSNVY